MYSVLAEQYVVAHEVTTFRHNMQSVFTNAGYEGEATAAHDNITDVADEDTSCCCIPVNLPSFVAWAVSCRTLMQLLQPAGCKCK